MNAPARALQGVEIAAWPLPDSPSPALAAAVKAACGRIAPLWPLKHFVAVNPFLGFADKSFPEACAAFERNARTPMLAPKSYFASAIASGAVTDADLAYALAQAPAGYDGPSDVMGLKAFALAPETAPSSKAAVATVADILDRLAASERRVSRTAFMVDEISRFCAAYFDEGQAAWKAPWRGLSPYAAWREAMRFDRNAEVMGVKGFRQSVASLPAEPLAAIAAVTAALAIPERALEDYLFRALFDIQGWAAYARYRVWESELYGRSDDTLVELLAVRVAFGYALFRERTDEAFTRAWAEAMQTAAEAPAPAAWAEDGDLAGRVLLQIALEHAYQRKVQAQLTARKPPSALKPPKPLAQAAFCIDVRSEVFRRALETTAPDVETIGFAGFFGFPIEYVPIGATRGGAQCPVLLKPGVVVHEAVKGANAEEETETLGLRLLRRRATKAWKAFKLSAVSSFTYVETMGLGFGLKLLSDALGATRPVPDPSRDGLDRRAAERLGPKLEPQIVDGRATGFAPEARVAMAEAVLRAMSLTGPFARLVLLAGHGSTTVNNPHASGLDCGACGGHTGEANARVAAAVLNDAGVQLGLAARGINVPFDTLFVPALHDTTTDEVTLFDVEAAPASHQEDLDRLKARLAEASALARAERAAALRLDAGAPVEDAILARSRDWSQVRPEWGLAGCAAFIAAPRGRTLGLDLAGRSFLHSYDWRADQGFGVLELIMSAPMVVASWINLQYYGSSVNNRAFGSGNKTLHNVVGALGVLEGNGGDLRPGLPFQSVHDGERLVHEPLRLHVFIEAPQAAMNAVIAKHESVRQLLDNGWVHLFAIEEHGAIARYEGGGRWGPAQA